MVYCCTGSRIPNLQRSNKDAPRLPQVRGRRQEPEAGEITGTLTVVNDAGNVQWTMAYVPGRLAFVDGSGYFLKFSSEADIGPFFAGTLPTAAHMVQGGASWENDGGMQLQPSNTITRSDGSHPFSPNEAYWSLDEVSSASPSTPASDACGARVWVEVIYLVLSNASGSNGTAESQQVADVQAAFLKEVTEDNPIQVPAYFSWLNFGDRLGLSFLHVSNGGALAAVC